MKRPSTAIISSDSAGVLLASRLEAAGHDVILIDTANGPKDRPYRSALPVFPATPELTTAIEGLELASLLNFTEAPPLKIEDEQAKPFVGFGGDLKSPAVSVLSAYNRTEQFVPTHDLEEWIETLRSTLKAKVLSYSELTSLEFAGPRIEKITINGSQDIRADRYIFMNAPYDLLTWLPQNALAARARSRIAKTPAWARVTLQMQHPQAITEIRAPIFLAPGSGEVDPFVGIFSAQNTGDFTRYTSTWETYIPQEFSEDSEHISAVFRNTRRLIRKAFPNVEEKPKETLSVVPAAAADFSWLKEQPAFQDIAENFYVSSPLATGHLGLAQCIIAAHEARTWALQAPAEVAPGATPTLYENQSPT